MSAYHTIILVGNVGAEPEERITHAGKPVVVFPVVENHVYKLEDGKKVDDPTWFSVYTHGRWADTVRNHLRKGTKVLVEGRLISNEDGHARAYLRKDGTPAARHEISASNLRFLAYPNDRGEEDPADEEEFLY